MAEEPTPRIYSHSAEELTRTASDPALTEDAALALLARRDLPGEVLEALSNNPETARRRRILFAVAAHAKTPRHVSLPMIRHLYTFELMELALSPAVLADIKRAAEEALVARLEKITLGERITLGRRASGRVAAGLLLDPEQRVVEAALGNPFLTEALVVRALMSAKASSTLVELVCRHAEWAPRREVRITLLRNPHTPQAAALEFARTLPSGMLAEVLQESRLPEMIRARLQEECASREKAEGKSAQI